MVFRRVRSSRTVLRSRRGLSPGTGGTEGSGGWRDSKEIASELGPLCVEWRLPRPGQARSASYEGEGYIIVRHPRTEVVEEALGQIITRVRVELQT